MFCRKFRYISIGECKFIILNKAYNITQKRKQQDSSQVHLVNGLLVMYVWCVRLLCRFCGFFSQVINTGQQSSAKKNDTIKVQKDANFLWMWKFVHFYIPIQIIRRRLSFGMMWWEQWRDMRCAHIPKLACNVAL